MRNYPILAMFLLLSVNAPAFADDPSVATLEKKAPDLAPVPDGGIYLGGGGGATPDGRSPTLMGSLVIDRQMFWRIGVLLTGEWTYIARDGQDPDFALRLCAGVRLDAWRSDDKKVRVVTDVAFAHQHEATGSMWLKYPLENALGESKYGLGHRSGVELGAGLLLTPWIDSQNWFFRRLRGLVRVSGLWLPDGAGPMFYLSLLTSVGVAI
jgi:hypothetical protein